MKLPDIAVYILAVAPTISLAKTPSSLRHLQNGPFQGGNGQNNGGNRQQHRGEFFDDFDQEHVTIECDAANSCETRDGDVGTWACRSLTHPVSGETLSRALCIPNDRAWPSGRFKEPLVGVSPLLHYLISQTYVSIPFVFRYVWMLRG